LFLDAARENQYGFQDPANNVMSAIVDLHHEIMMLEFIVLGLIVFMLVRICMEGLNYENDNPFVDLKDNNTHHTLLEIV
jgi:heme/copper-type cytochrome/quinol oxidase subunit 2